MEWTFVWMMVVLKIPIAAMLYSVWWAIHQRDPEEPVTEDDGGVRPPHRPRVPGRRPRSRGPHGAPGAATAPPRVRTALAPVRARADRPHT